MSTKYVGSNVTRGKLQKKMKKTEKKMKHEKNMKKIKNVMKIRGKQRDKRETVKKNAENKELNKKNCVVERS